MSLLPFKSEKWPSSCPQRCLAPACLLDYHGIVFVSIVLQCYCFVCDIAAPCATWKGHANYGHCHASDKDKFWMTMRGVARAKLQKT
jgi:hypothetical protein